MSDLVVVDLFAGGGGGATGAELAAAERGLELELHGVNHWGEALETYATNHPKARVYRANIQALWPRHVVPHGKIHVLIAGIECTHFSRARGGRPVSDQRRSQAEWVLKWLDQCDIDWLLIENVPEFQSWGDVDERGRPVSKLRGRHFVAWLNKLRRRGYRYEYRVLNCANYGDATTRERFFLIARKGKGPIAWPEPTHSKHGGTDLFGKTRPWVPAAACIDWSDLGPSLFERPKPLAVNTRRRMARGFQRYGGVLGPLFIRLLDLPDEEAAKFGIVGDHLPEPFLSSRFNGRGHVGCRSVGDPLTTIVGKGGNGLVTPTAEPIFVFANRAHNVARGVDQPIPALTTATGGGSYLVSGEAMLVGQQSDAAARPVSQPGPTIATAGVIRLATSLLIPYYGTGVAAPDTDPVRAITATDRFGLAVSLVVPCGGPHAEARSTTGPTHTIMPSDRLGLAATFAVPYYGEANGQAPRVLGLGEPLDSVTAAGRFALVGAFLAPKFGERADQEPRTHGLGDPAPTITGEGAGRLVSAGISDLGGWDDLAASIEAAVREIDPRRLIVLNAGAGPVLCRLDIRFRMLKPVELAKATGFPDGYAFRGNKTDQVRQIGNAIPVNTMAALFGSILDASPWFERRAAS